MKKIILFVTLLVTILISNSMAAQTIYDYNVSSLEGGAIDFSEYKGKKILIVNTASECGFTPQYAQLEDLYKEHQSDLVVIGFPANNFGGQEPGKDSEIAAFCEKNYGLSFPMASKVSVKGKDQAALFKWLTTADNPDFTGNIKWNFEKFLIDEQGKLIRRFRSSTTPLDEEILNAIAQ